jgi:hypothetical protein
MTKKIRYAYYAGYIDGEGCLRHHHSPCVKVTNTFPSVLMALRKEFGGSINVRVPKPGSLNRHCWNYEVWGDKARALVRAVKPFLREKKEQAILLLHKQIDESKLKRLKRLNHPVLPAQINGYRKQHRTL